MLPVRLLLATRYEVLVKLYKCTHNYFYTNVQHQKQVTTKGKVSLHVSMNVQGQTDAGLSTAEAELHYSTS